MPAGPCRRGRSDHHMSALQLVTGGCGFIGAPLVRALVRAGHRVRVLDNGSRGSVDRLRDMRGEVEVFEGDVRDPEIVRQAVRGVTSVCHLAAVNGTAAFYDRPVEVLEVGVKGMVNVLDACREARVRQLIFLSSSEVYQTPPVVPTDELVPLSIPDPHNPRYSYAGSKIISELMALHWGRAFFDRALIVRPHNVFGPAMGWEHVIPQLTTRLVRLRTQHPGQELPLPIQGDGAQQRAFIYIDDCIEALLRVIERGEHLAIYHIGTSEIRSIRDVACQIAACLGVMVRLVPGPEAPGGTLRRCPDIRRLEGLGFAPHVPFHDGLRMTVEWYATHTTESTDARVALPTANA